MRTTPEECTRIGRRLAETLNRSRGPVELLIPLKGVSALDAPGRPFEDAAANQALVHAIEETLDPASCHVRLVKTPLHLNDPEFADQAARAVLDLLKTSRPAGLTKTTN
jgi:uncharacterized protein (UPF0261 family)